MGGMEWKKGGEREREGEASLYYVKTISTIKITVGGLR